MHPSILHVFCREGLLPGELPAGRRVVLEGQLAAGSTVESIEASFNGSQAWIDAEAAALAQQVSGEGSGPREKPTWSAAWHLALELRYYSLKLLRLIDWFERCAQLKSGDEVVLWAESPRDDDYVELLHAVCQLAGAALVVRRKTGTPPSPVVFPVNSPLRRALGRCASWLPAGRGTAGGARVVLCGNPRILEPICPSLLAAGASLAWLYDRFAYGSLWRWRGRIAQMVCNLDQGPTNRLRLELPGAVAFRGIDLRPIVRRWLADRAAVWGARQTRALEAIERHFVRFRPQVVVLDEDATPFARAAVAVARSQGIPSVVLQHGAPCCRFGFAPLAADELLAWGASSHRQFVAWGIPPAQIRSTGSPYHEQVREDLVRAAWRRQPADGEPLSYRQFDEGFRRGDYATRLLLLATAPPRDDRPDAVELNFNRSTYAGLVRVAFCVASRLGATLHIKPHPRAASDVTLGRIAAEFPQVSCQTIRTGTLAETLRDIDCVLSLGSTAGVDAALSGVPVIHLVPAGSRRFLAEGDWGFQGVARTERELFDLLNRAILAPRPVATEPTLGLPDRRPSQRVAEHVLNLASRSTRRGEIAAPHLFERPAVQREPQCQ